MSLMYEMNQKALELGVPISVHLDVSYRCNERCVHCYLDHDDHGEMTLAEMRDVLDQMAEAGVFFLTISGGEVLMRMDFCDILTHARARMVSGKLKTNALMTRERATGLCWGWGSGGASWSRCSAIRSWWGMWRSSARCRPRWTTMRWTCIRAAPAIPPATSLLTEICIPACSFRCPAGTCGSRNFWI